MTLSSILLEYRRKNNLSQRQFARLCGLSNACISLLEKGQIGDRGPSSETMSKLAVGMDLSTDDLLELIEDQSGDNFDFIAWYNSLSGTGSPPTKERRKKAFDLFKQLNETGQEKVISIMEDLICLEKYRR